jgi:hypothetical protein
MCAKYHVTRPIDNAIIGVCGNLERFKELFRVYCYFILLCADGVECYQQLVVISLCIIQEGTNNFLMHLIQSGNRGADVSLSGMN